MTLFKDPVEREMKLLREFTGDRIYRDGVPVHSWHLRTEKKIAARTNSPDLAALESICTGEVAVLMNLQKPGQF